MPQNSRTTTAVCFCFFKKDFQFLTVEFKGGKDGEVGKLILRQLSQNIQALSSVTQIFLPSVVTGDDVVTPFILNMVPH